MKGLLTCIICVFALMAPSSAQQPFVIVELFTSEGCSSCPPAEKVFSQLKNETESSRQPVIFLEYHVDYWNRGGWKDPFSKNQFTLRQENYSRIMAGHEMYTPQLLLNGEEDISATDLVKAKTSIQKKLNTGTGTTIRIEKQETLNDTLVVEYSLSKPDKNASVKIAVTEDQLETDVTNGENKGKKLKHNAVVRVFYSSQSGEEHGVIKIPLKGFVPKSGMQLIAFLQEKKTMRILGATKMNL
jgi:hypothetical protein